MGASTAAGTKISIGTTASNGVTDTYAEIAEVVNIPEFGRTYNEITHSPLSTRAVQKFKGSYNDGSVAVQLAKDAGDAGQAALIVALDVDADYNFKVEANDHVPALTLTGVAMSAASPGVVTKVAHGLTANTPIKFTAGSGTLPTGVTDGTTYFVKTVSTADTFTISATVGGAAITTTGSPTGTYTVTTVPTNTIQYMKAKVMSYTTNYGTLDQVVGSTVTLGIKSGSIVEVAKMPTSVA